MKRARKQRLLCPRYKASATHLCCGIPQPFLESWVCLTWKQMILRSFYAPKGYVQRCPPRDLSWNTEPFCALRIYYRTTVNISNGNFLVKALYHSVYYILGNLLGVSMFFTECGTTICVSEVPGDWLRVRVCQQQRHLDASSFNLTSNWYLLHHFSNAREAESNS